MNKQTIIYVLLLTGIVALFIAVCTIASYDSLVYGILAMGLLAMVVVTFVYALSAKSCRKKWWWLFAVLAVIFGVQIARVKIYDRQVAARYADDLKTPVIFRYSEHAYGSSTRTTLDRVFHSDSLFVDYDEISDYSKPYRVTDKQGWQATLEQTDKSLVVFDIIEHKYESMGNQANVTFEDVDWDAIAGIYESLCAGTQGCGKIYFQQKNTRVYWRF